MSAHSFSPTGERNRPTIASLSRIADSENFNISWRQERLEKGLGELAAATIEQTSVPIEDPEHYFEHVADVVELFEDGAVAHLKEPVGRLGFRAIVSTFAHDGAKPIDSFARRGNGIRFGFVSRTFDTDEQKMRANGGWPSWNRTQFAGMYDQRVLARQFGAKVVRPGREYSARLGGADMHSMLYSQIPILSPDQAVQRKFIQGVEDNFLERSSEDEIVLLSNSIAEVVPADGALLQSAELLYANDFAKAVDAVSKEDHFTGEHLSKGPFVALLKWFAMKDQNDSRFSEYVARMVPYETSSEMFRDGGRYSFPQAALVAPNVWDSLQSIVEGKTKIVGFGPKAVRATAVMMKQYEERQKQRELSGEALTDKNTPVIERLDFYDREDARDLGALMAELTSTYDGRPVSKELVEEIIYSPDRDLIIARINEKIVGTATVSKVVTMSGGVRGQLDSFVTLSEVRGKGIGGMIRDEIIQWCKDNKIAQLEFTSHSAREQAHRFYRDWGAEIKDTTVLRVAIT